MKDRIIKQKNKIGDFARAVKNSENLVKKIPKDNVKYLKH